MKINWCFFFVLLFNLPSFGQADSLLLNGKTVTIDHLGNAYQLIKRDTLQKQTFTKNQRQYNYSNMRLGEIHSYNTQNPFRIIASHSEFSTLVFLDNTLRETNRIFLPDVEIYTSPVAYAQANDNSIWLYDDMNAQLLRVNEKGTILSKTIPLIQHINFVPEVQEMQTNDEYIILADNTNGLIICDQFGTYIQTLKANNVQNWQIGKNILYIQQNNTIFEYDIQLLTKKEIYQFKEDEASIFKISPNIYFKRIIE